MRVVEMQIECGDPCPWGPSRVTHARGGRWPLESGGWAPDMALSQNGYAPDDDDGDDDDDDADDAGDEVVMMVSR
eukprot:2671970-Pyramimonas_sp.AAC.1